MKETGPGTGRTSRVPEQVDNRLLQEPAADYNFQTALAGDQVGGGGQFQTGGAIGA